MSNATCKRIGETRGSRVSQPKKLTEEGGQKTQCQPTYTHTTTTTKRDCALSEVVFWDLPTLSLSACLLCERAEAI